MKKVILVLHFTLCILHFAFSQSPLVKIWDKRYGGVNDDWITSMLQTRDGGFILGGQSTSGISGDKSEAGWGLNDYWIVKIDSIGYKQWDKRFGGIDSDWLTCIKQTSDGGFILGGYSNSGISGDKTQMTWGGNDYWVVKIDSLGIKQWDRNFGGLNDDQLYSIDTTIDMGYILGGYSNSGISGDKSEATSGIYDYWIMKIDSLGNKQWDKDFGGTDDDQLSELQQTSDEGYILCGYSRSLISGSKTQNTWGYWDYWIIKIDSIGNKLWDKDLGGIGGDYLYSLEQLENSEYILGGISNSTISGDKTQSGWGDYDYWIVKIDSLGNKIFDFDFGGSDHEELYSISQTQDGGYLISGDSYSPISGNKTENNLGFEQTWVIKTDSLCNILWDKTIFTSGHDEDGLAIETNEGCYAIANLSDAGIGGYKTEPCWGQYDYWIVKFCHSLLANFTSTTVICPGNCVDFLNLSVQASSYQWYFQGANPDTSTSANPANICYATPGTYDVQLIASNANGSDTLLLTNYITVYPSPPPQSITQNGDTLSAIAGSAIYQWYFNGNIINGATDYIYLATQSGDYNVVATDSNGCEVEAVINDVIASIQYTVDSKQITAFPNPVTTTLDVRGLKNSSTDEIKIFDVFGEKVFSATNYQLPISIPMAIGIQLPSGIYYLEILSDNKIYRTKFIKQ